MKKIYSNWLIMLVAGALVTSCADYNVTDDFHADPDPTISDPYYDLAPVKTYIAESQYPNMSIGATLKVKNFNKQELEHAAIVTNFNNVSFGSTLMSGSIINNKGTMDFTELKNLLDHVGDINSEVYGSPIAANTGQADGWFSYLTAPIEIFVDYVDCGTVDYTKMSTFTGTVEKGTAAIAKYDGMNTLKINNLSNVRIIEGFEANPLATYNITFWIRCDKDGSYNITFAGKKIDGTGPDGKWTVKAGLWTKVVVESKPAEDVTDGYLRIENTRSGPLYVQKVEMGYYPDNHRPQTAEELKDTINYALNTWCDGLMKNVAGRITSYDLIEDAIDNKAELENGMLDLKHSTEKIFWQDIFGSENYAPAVSKAARAAYEKYEGNPSDLKFFIAELGLENEKKLESLKYWINIWDAKGAKIDGINAKVNLAYYEDAEKQQANAASFNALLQKLAATGKLIRISNFDIKYIDSSNAAVAPDKITDEQRQALANYNASAIKSYLTLIPSAQQAGLCKSNIADTATDPVGLWNVNTKTSEWTRNATYKAWCEALSGK